MTLAWLIALAALAALAQGAAFVALLPLLSALAEGDDATAWRFTGVIAGLAAAHAVLSLAAGTVGRANSAAVLSSLLRSLGERVLTLPLGYVTKSTAGRFSEMASSGIAFAASVPHVILRPVIAAVVAPTVIAFGILAVDWRVGLVLVASAPVLFFAYRAIGRVGGESDEAHADAVAAVSGRLIEFTRCQQAIRAASDGSAADAMVDEAIRAQHDAFAKATSTQGGGHRTVGFVRPCGVHGGGDRRRGSRRDGRDGAGAFGADAHRGRPVHRTDHHGGSVVRRFRCGPQHVGCVA
ncbi:hypothetical protein [Corynebacterium bovis]|nr:hypothetical protein [Corynebacterium bovis]MDN8578420.1 hypothetical protein [Corynebacterium bovis]